MNYKKTKTKLKIRKYTYEFFVLAIGCFIMACGTSIFLLPNQLSSGGFSGIATISYYLLKIPLGTAMLILNIPLLVLSFIRKGKLFLIKSLSGTVLLAVFIDILDQFPSLTQDRFLGCVYGRNCYGNWNSIGIKVRIVNWGN